MIKNSYELYEYMLNKENVIINKDMVKYALKKAFNDDNLKDIDFDDLCNDIAIPLLKNRFNIVVDYESLLKEEY